MAAAVRPYLDHPALPDTKTPIFYLLSNKEYQASTTTTLTMPVTS